MVFFGKGLLQSCIFHQNIFTEARIHQKSAAGKSISGGCQRCSDSSFFESDTTPDPRGRNPVLDPNPEKSY